jgi:copper chaperone
MGSVGGVEESGMGELTYSVPGISCSHCGQAISSEVGKVAGVTGVDVDIEARTVAVQGSAVDDASVRTAIVEAGYEAVAPASS